MYKNTDTAASRSPERFSAQHNLLSVESRFARTFLFPLRSPFDLVQSASSGPAAHLKPHLPRKTPA